MSLSNPQPLYPEGDSGWIVIIVGLLTVSSIIPAAFGPQNFIGNPSNGLQQMLSSTASYAFNQSMLVGALIISLGKKLIKYFYVILILVAILNLIIMINEFDQDIYKGIDKGATGLALPAYRTVGVPVARFAQINYDIGICWWDLQAMWRNILIRDVVNIALECEDQNWQTTVNTTMQFVGKTLSIPMLFAQADGKEPFAFEPALSALAAALGSFEPTLQCSCAELQFAYTLIFDTIENPNLHAALDRGLNAILYHPLNITVGALEPAFGIGPLTYDCTDSNVTVEIACALARPPEWIGLRVSVCEFGFYTGQFLEDTVNLIVDLFVDDSIFSGNLFNFHKIISSLVCIASHLVFDLLDLLTHIDLVFNSDIQYLQLTPFLQLMDQFNLLCDGVREFWLTFDDSFTDDIGCIFAEMLRLILTSLDEVGKLIIALFGLIYDSNAMLNYFVAFNETRYSVPYLDLKNCTFHLLIQINERSFEVAKQWSNFIEDDAQIAIKGIRVLSQNPTNDDVNNFILVTLPLITNRTAVDLHGIFAATANWFRQFDETNSCTYADLNPPVITTLGNPSEHVICNLANIIETIGQFLRSLWVLATDIIYRIYFDVVNAVPLSDVTIFLDRINQWLQGELLLVYQNLLESVSSFIGSWFGDVNCPCVGGSGCSTGSLGLVFTRVRGNVKQVVSAIMDAIIGLFYHSLQLFFTLIADILAAGPTYTQPEITSILCEFLKGILDIAGRFWYVFKTVGDFLDCLIGKVLGNSINIFSSTTYFVLFEVTNSNSVRNILCTVVTETLDFFDFIYKFLTRGFAYIISLITNGSIEVINLLIGIINDMIADLNSSLGVVSSLVNSIVAGIRAVICFLNQLSHIFDCFGSLAQTTTYSFSIPDIDLGSVPFGELGTIDLGTVPGFSITSPTLPDINGLSDAVTCLNTAASSFGSGCLSGCGPGPVSSPICTITVNIPDVPTIPTIPPVKRYQTMEPQQTMWTFEDHPAPSYKRQQPSLPANYSFFNEVMQNYSMKLCDIYKRIAENTTVAEDLRIVYFREFVSCVSSAQIVFAFNWKTFGNDTGDWVDPMALTSATRFFFGLVNVGSKLYGPVNSNMLCLGAAFEDKLRYNQTNSSLTSSCVSWDDYYAQHNLTSPWTYKIGKKLETVRLDLLSSWAKQNKTYGLMSFFASIWNGLSGAGDIIFGVQPGADHSIYDSFWKTYSAYQGSIGDTGVKRFVTERMSPVIFHETSAAMRWNDPNFIGFNVSRTFSESRAKLYSFLDKKREKVVNYLQPKSERAVRNQRVFGSMSHLFGGMYKEYSYHYGLYGDQGRKHHYAEHGRNLPMLFSVAKVDMNNLESMEMMYAEWLQATPLGKEKIKHSMLDQIENVRQGRKRTVEIMPVDDSICGIPLLHGQTTCINCTLIKRALDELIDRTTECIAISLRNLDLLNTEFFEPFVQRITNPFALVDAESDGVFGQWLTIVAGMNITDLASKYDTDKLIPPTQFESTQPQFSFIIDPTQKVSDYIDDNLIGPTLRKITSADISIRNIITGVRQLITGVSASAANSIFFWLKFYFGVTPTMNCEKLAQRGIGFGNLPLTFFLVLIFFFVLFALAARISYNLMAIFIPLVFLFPYIVVSLNYGVSPLSAPALPFCLADDVFKVVKYFDVDCVSWHKVFPGMTNDTCVDDRDFLRCSDSPYFFNNPWRVAFFLLDISYPAGLDFIKNNNHYFLQLFRSINGMETMLNFDYKPGDPTDQYFTCLKRRFVNLYIFYLYLGLLALLVSSAALSVALAITFLSGLVHYAGLLSLAVGGGLSGAQMATNGTPIKSIEDYIIRNVSAAPASSGSSGLGLFFSPGESNSRNLFANSEVPKKSNPSKTHIKAFTKAMFPMRKKQD
jgi:hypothetical protein